MESLAVGAVSESAGVAPLFPVMAVGNLNSVDLGPLSRNVSQMWLRRENARTAANEKLVLPAGIDWIVCVTYVVGQLNTLFESNAF